MRSRTLLSLALLLLASASGGLAAERYAPAAGRHATALRPAWLFVAPSLEAQKLNRAVIGREMVVVESNGRWLRVFANTDHPERGRGEAGELASTEPAPPISGWIEARGIVLESNPSGDRILMGEAATQEALAAEARSAADSAQNARRLYLRLAEFYPLSPLLPEARWRAADIQWQLEKDEAERRPSAREPDRPLRATLDERELREIVKKFPHTRQADLAAFALLDSRLDEGHGGQEKRLAKEAELYENYAAERPESPRAAQALYLALTRQAALHDLYASASAGRAGAALAHAQALAGRLAEKFPRSDYACRAAALVYKLEEGLVLFGQGRE